MRYRTWSIHNLKRIGLSPSLLIVIYKSLVRPCFDYACVVYHSMLSKRLSELLERQQRRILKIIYGYDLSYEKALERAGIERLDARRSLLRERFVVKLARNDRFSDWFPVNETPVHALRHVAKFVEKPFRTERLRGAPLYSFRRIMNFLESEKNNE